jgi:hypothetical protein
MLERRSPLPRKRPSTLPSLSAQPLEQLAVGERAERAHVEERPQLQERVAAVLDRHESSLPFGFRKSHE